MLIKEYRITMPMSVSEYQIAQLYCVAEASKQNTDGEEGIEVITNEPFDNHPLLEGKFVSGQYTYKIYHLASKFPAFVRFLLPRKSMAMHEQAWNAYPYCRTILTNPTLSAETFQITIDSMHLEDRGQTENVHSLPPDLLSKREIIYIDILKDCPGTSELFQERDVMTYKSLKTSRGPLSESWQETCKPVMTCYKLVTAHFKWLGLQTRVENWIQTSEQRLFLDFHRKMYCNTDDWYGMTMTDIREMERLLKEELEKILKNRKSSATS